MSLEQLDVVCLEEARLAMIGILVIDEDDYIYMLPFNLFRNNGAKTKQTCVLRRSRMRM